MAAFIDTEKTIIPKRDKSYLGEKQSNFAFLLSLFMGALLLYSSNASLGMLTKAIKNNHEISVYSPIIYTGIMLLSVWGISLILSALFLFIRKIIISIKAERSTQNWRKDYFWPDQILVSSSNYFGFLKEIFVLILLSILMIVIGLTPFIAPDIDGTSTFFCIGFSLLFLFFMGRKLWHAIKSIQRDISYQFQYGTSSLVPNNLPFYIGQELQADFINKKVCQEFNKLDVSLQLIQEKYDDPHDESRSIIFERMYLMKEEFPCLNNRCPIHFIIPASLPPNNLSQKYPIYWVLDITAKNKRAKYNCSFLLPVYPPNSDQQN